MLMVFLRRVKHSGLAGRRAGAARWLL